MKDRADPVSRKMKALSTPAGIRKKLFALLNVTQFTLHLLQLSYIPIRLPQRFLQQPLDSTKFIKRIENRGVSVVLLCSPGDWQFFFPKISAICSIFSTCNHCKKAGSIKLD